MKTSTAIEPLKSALAKRNNLVSEIADLHRLSESQTASLASLETSCDLADKTALDEIARSQTILALLPRRVAARENALTESEHALLKACHSFISENLAPRIRELIKRAKAKASAQLKAHYADADELERAVNKTTMVVDLERFIFWATIRDSTGNQLCQYAEQLLNTWAECDQREAKL